MKACFEKIKLEIYGESHAEKVGMNLDGVGGFTVHKSYIENVLSRRKSGKNVWSTPRMECDNIEYVNGFEQNGDNLFLDDCLVAEIKNSNIKPQDYKNVAIKPRPSHADFVAFKKDGEIKSGGGRFSGRLTAPLCIAGAIAKEILEQNGIFVGAYISSIKGIECGSYKDIDCKSLLEFEDCIRKVQSNSLPILNAKKRIDIENQILSASKNNDSVGGKIECVVFGIEAGKFGDALFEGLEGKISYSVFGVPAVKGVEFGDGFDLCHMFGSEANDEFFVENEKVFTKTNKSGGINGGISNGMPIALSVAIRPTPSIGKKQNTIELESLTNTQIEINGRHDACIVPRAVVCVECAVALALLDELLKG